MKTLSIRHPWALYILRYGKDVENRTWPTAFRGRILVHAGKEFDGEPWQGMFGGSFFGDVFGLPEVPVSAFARGALLGYVTITDCVRNHPSRWAQAGQWHFVLSDPVEFAVPIPYRGRLGFFDVPDDIIAGVEVRP